MRQNCKNNVRFDNLNTRNASAFYEFFSADEDFALAQRFAFCYTPEAVS